MTYLRKLPWALAACLLSAAALAASLGPGELAARKLGAALAARDYQTVADLTHPAVVKAAGGPEAVTKRLQTANAGLTIHSMKFGKPEQLASVGDTRIGVFPYRSRVTLNDKTVEFGSFYIGFSWDRKSWKFIDCEGVTQDYLAKLLPGYNDNLALKGC